MITAAGVVVVIHFAFVVFVVLGGLLVFKWRWTALLHIPAVIWGALIEIFGWTCPLTPMENRLRESDGFYEGDFIQHYLWSLLYPDELTRSLQILMGMGVILVNLTIYGLVMYRARTSR